MSTLKWKTHADLAIRTTPTIGREEYLDFMTFQRNDRPMIMEIFGPLLGLKEEWEAQGATPEELDFSAFTYRFAGRRYLGVTTGMVGGYTPEVLEENDEVKMVCSGWLDLSVMAGLCPRGMESDFDRYSFPVISVSTRFRSSQTSARATPTRSPLSPSSFAFLLTGSSSR